MMHRLPTAMAWKDEEALIAHSPLEIETRRDRLDGDPVTPLERLYIRSNLPMPDEAQLRAGDDWTISLEGVSAPRSIRLGELKTLAPRTLACVMQCTGNGRLFFPNEIEGAKWETGAAANLRWTGVPVADLAQLCGGPSSNALFMTATGGEPLPDHGDRLDHLVERSVPIEAMEDAILAWQVNDTPIPGSHGGPLRLVVPGYFAVNSIKYVTRLAFTETETLADIQLRRYRFHMPGTLAKPGDRSAWRMPVKSWINRPIGGQTAQGPVRIEGIALTGEDMLEGVEISFNDGESWVDARWSGPDLGRYAWRAFRHETSLVAGDYRVVSRARTASGTVQPRDFPPNEGGYGHNGWADHGVRFRVA